MKIPDIRSPFGRPLGPGLGLWTLPTEDTGPADRGVPMYQELLARIPETFSAWQIFTALQGQRARARGGAESRWDAIDGFGVTAVEFGF